MSEELTLQTRLLRHLGDACLTIGVIAEDLELSHDQISTAMRKLIARGYVARVETGCFQLTREGRVAAEAGVSIRPGPRGPHSRPKKPQPDTLLQRAWSAMRIRRRFTVRDIAMVAARKGNEQDAVEGVGRFLRRLAQAGYVEPVGKEPGTRPGSHGFTRYALKKDTGQIAPSFSEKRGAIHDHNTGEDVPCSPR